MAKVWLKKLVINDGTTINLEKDDIVVFVGPNNSGKSAVLKELDSLLQSNSPNRVIIKQAEISKEGTDAEMLSYIEPFSTKTFDHNPLPTYSGLGFTFYEGSITHFWNNTNNGLQGLHRAFVNILTTESRLSAANPATNISTTTQAPQHPIHLLQRDDNIEEKFNEYFSQAFGTDLIVHRNAGSQVPLYVGEKPIVEQGEDRVSIQYLKKLEKLPQLHLQGDGMRSFVGVLLNAFISTYSILLLDEPEAFLHPPQARLLGKMLAKDLPSDKQLFISTHSEDFLKGLLDSSSQRIKIVRITRKGDRNYINQLDKDDIRSIWSDSLLRHSNILAGLFHTKVIICESDSDCRFYSAVLQSLFEGTNKMTPDFLYINCGGKHRIPIAVKALKKLGVQIVVVTDFDILNDENPIKDIVAELGGNWNELKDDWKKIKLSIDAKRPELEVSDLKAEFNAVFSDIQEKIMPKDKVVALGKLLKKASPWSIAKETGKGFIPSGDLTVTYQSLNSIFQSLGLQIVELGELESFVKSVGNHGPKWVNEVLKKDLKSDPELEEARDFVKRF